MFTPVLILCVLTFQKSDTIYISDNVLNKNSIQYQCPKGFNGTIANYLDCSKYINCTNGFSRFLQCPEGKLFDVTKNVCANADDVVCFNSNDIRKKRALYNIDNKCKSEDILRKQPVDCNIEEQSNVLESEEMMKNDESVEMIKQGFLFPEFRENNLQSNSGHTCGYRYIRNKVMGGSKSKRREYPWQVAVRIMTAVQYVHHCGAVVISSKFLLSAAHCFEGYTKENFIVYVGDYKETIIEGTEQSDYISNINFYPYRNSSSSRRYDIAVLELQRGLHFNEHVQPICLPDEDINYEKSLICTFSGFGSSSKNEESSPVLKYGYVPLILRRDCTRSNVYGGLIYDDMFCAGYFDGRVDTCAGDSGGPLACQINGVFTLYGITSWGANCGMVNKPGVYAKVAYFRKWIDRIINNDN